MVESQSSQEGIVNSTVHPVDDQNFRNDSHFQDFSNFQHHPVIPDFSENVSNFQDFYAFQRYIARFSTSFQYLQHPHFPNEHFAQEQTFSTGFLGRAQE